MSEFQLVAVVVLVAQSCPTLCDPMDSSIPGLPVLHHILEFAKFMSTELGMLPKHIIFCRPLLFLPSILFSIRISSNELALGIRWPKYWRFSLSNSHSKKYSGLISFRTDWFDVLAVQGTLKSSPTPQFKSIDSSALSLLYGPTLTSVHGYWKNHNFDYMDLCWQSDIFAF